MSLGQRGVAFIGPGCHLVTYIITSLHPPYPVLIFAFILAGFGHGLVDAAWNAWVGNMADANEILGFLHGFYGLGATLSPLIATSLVTKAKWPWYSFYYFMVCLSSANMSFNSLVSSNRSASDTVLGNIKTGAAVIELAVSVGAFWQETGRKFREENPRRTTGEEKGGRLREALSNRVPWMIAFFLLGYVGVEGGSFFSSCKRSIRLLMYLDSGAGWLACHIHDASPQGRAIRIRYDCRRFLAWPHHGSGRLGVRHGKNWREDGR